MKVLSDMLAEAYTTWLSSVSHCCAPLASCLNEKPRQSISEKPSGFVLRDQPRAVPAPFAGAVAQESFRPRTRGSEKEKAPRKSFSSTRTSFSVKKRFRSNASSTRRPQISAPTNFQHLHSESFHFPQYTHLQTVPRPRPASFRPLELSIYLPDRELSPLLPDFDIITPPPPARVHDSRTDDGFNLAHERSYSSMSFHLPRRHTDSPSTAQDPTPPRVPPKSRARAYTSPSVEQMKERIASAMIEVEKLQREIDSVIERQSIYVSSRPTTAQSMVPTITGLDMELMPSMPALPPAAPSFAERLNPGIDRPNTAPARPPFHIPHRAKSFTEASSAFLTPPPSRGRDEHPPPPPLPLVLRPPLRKKKSFSRVSTWLFPNPEHQRDMSIDSVTNLPRPVKGREGFYQCIEGPGQSSERRSFETVTTVSTWETEDGDRTVPTTWSPGSSPATKQAETPLERTATFGAGPRRESVGVAF